MLLLDLDHTIFPTNTISAEPFLPLLQMAEAHILSVHGPEKAKSVHYDLWHLSFDQVAIKYDLSLSFQQGFYKQLNILDYQLDIQVFPDYVHLLEIPQPRILVTTGFRKLQETKIKALNILQDFSEIHIDDPSDQNRIFKQGIFTNILRTWKLRPQDVWVIGDSPHNELRAGKALGMRTIQRLKPGVEKSELADQAIHSFAELKLIL